VVNDPLVWPANDISQLMLFSPIVSDMCKLIAKWQRCASRLDNYHASLYSPMKVKQFSRDQMIDAVG
jgi:hypothetical protein